MILFQAILTLIKSVVKPRTSNVIHGHGIDQRQLNTVIFYLDIGETPRKCDYDNEIKFLSDKHNRTIVVVTKLLYCRISLKLLLTVVAFPVDI